MPMKFQFILYLVLSGIVFTRRYNYNTTGLVKHSISISESESKSEIRSINWNLLDIKDDTPFEHAFLTSSIIYPRSKRCFRNRFSTLPWSVKILEYDDIPDNWVFSENKPNKYYVSLEKEEGVEYQTKHLVTNTVDVLKYIIVKTIKETVNIFFEHFSESIDLLNAALEDFDLNKNQDLKFFDDIAVFKKTVKDFLLLFKDSVPIQHEIRENLLSTLIKHYQKKMENNTEQFVEDNLTRENYISIFEYARTISKVLLLVYPEKEKFSESFKELQSYDVHSQDSMIITKAIFLILNEPFFLPGFTVELLDNNNKEKKLISVEKDIFLSEKTLVIELEDIKIFGIEHLKIINQDNEIDINIKEKLRELTR